MIIIQPSATILNNRFLEPHQNLFLFPCQSLGNFRHQTAVIDPPLKSPGRLYYFHQISYGRIITKMWVWDYQIPKKWQPKTDQQWQWFLVRKINYGDFQGLKKETVKRYFNKIKEELDPGKRAMLENFFQNEA